MDFLKELLGEELFAQVEEALAGREDVQLANVADGSFIPAVETQDKDKKIAELTAKVEELTTQLEESDANKPDKEAGEAEARQTEQGGGKKDCAGKPKADKKQGGGNAKTGTKAKDEAAKAGDAAAKTNAAAKDNAAMQGGGEGTDPELEQAILDELEYAGAKNAKVVLALIDESKLEVGEENEVIGLSEQIDALKKSDPYLFEEEADTRGANPAGGGNPAAADSATRMNRMIRGAAGKQR